MKRLLSIIVCFVFALQMHAQDVDLLNRIKTINGQIKSVEADLVNTYIKSKKTIILEGKLYYVAPKDFAALFVPDNYMIVNTSHIKTNIGMFSGTFRLRDGGMLQSLSNTFLYGFQGRLQQLADENNYSLTTKTEGDYYIVTGTIKKKKLIGIGFKQVIFKYHIDSLLLKEIILCDYKGNRDIYTVSNIKYDVPVDPNTFVF